jgi:hypothetical protein
MGHPRLRITNYADHDLGFGILDYTGGDFTYDGHRGTDINANSFQDQDEGIRCWAANGRVIYVQDDRYDREISAPRSPERGVAPP